MWQFYAHIIDTYVGNKGILDELLQAAGVPLINFMVKDPENFKTGNFNGQSPLDMIFKFIQKIFADGRELGDEIHSMCAVTLIMALLEHLGSGIENHIHTINQFYLSELTNAETTHYKNMIIQGVMMNLWYNQQVTIQSLQSLGALE
jgi:hypothetical protein